MSASTEFLVDKIVTCVQKEKGISKITKNGRIKPSAHYWSKLRCDLRHHVTARAESFAKRNRNSAFESRCRKKY